MGPVRRRKNNRFSRVAAAGNVARSIYTGVRKAYKTFTKRKTPTKTSTKGKMVMGSKRRYRSRTNRCSNSAQATSQHNDQSLASISVFNKGRLTADRSKCKIKYSHTYDRLFSGLEGNQAVFELHAMLSTKAFLTAGTARNDQIQIGYPIFDMNPNRNNTGSQYINALSPIDSFINVEKIINDMTIYNATNSATDNFILFCVPVTDTNVSPTQWWQQCLGDERIGITPLTQATGVANSAIAGSIASPAIYGTWPTHCPSFKKLWTIKGVHRVTLQGGDERKLRLTYGVNRKVDRSYVGVANTTSNYMRNLTMVPMVITRGSCAINRNTLANPEVVWAATHTACILHEQYTFSVPRAPPNAPINLAFYGTLAGVPGADEVIINDVDAIVSAISLFS